MDAVHIHLLLNHVPVIGTIFCVFLLGYALLRKSDELKQLTLGLLVFTALVAIPVYLTGEPSEEAVENLAGVSEAIIEQHEDSAKLAFIFSILTGAIALINLFLYRFSEQAARWLTWALLLFSILNAGLMARTANLGGQIRHTEIRAGNAGATQDENPKTEKDDDDH